MKTTRYISLFLILAVLLSPMSFPVSAEGEGESIAYRVYDEETYTYISNEKLISDCTFIDETTTVWENGNVYVAEGTVTLDAVTVKKSAHLILADGCRLTVNGGIAVEQYDSLSVYAQSDGDSAGSLTVIGADDAAGIGSAGTSFDCGTVTIHGGTISATGGTSGAGIGGGYGGKGGVITICGGNISAQGGEGAAGIGGGEGGSGGNVTILAGTVSTQGGKNGAGIGGGYENDGGTLTLGGGRITAEGGEGGAGIGGGLYGNGGTVTLFDGVIHAVGGSNSYAIGAGRHGEDDGTVTIAENSLLRDTAAGTLLVSGYLEDYTGFFGKSSVAFTAIGIGKPISYLVYDTENGRFDGLTCRSYTAVNDTVTSWADGWYAVFRDITVDERITVTGDVHLILADHAVLAANGGINVGNGCSLSVYAQSDGTKTGILNAQGTGGSAGIGGTDGVGDCGTIVIHGGTITAFGGNKAAGIGSGFYYNGEGRVYGNVIVNGGSVNAFGGDSGAGIGGGSSGCAVNLTVNGGTVSGSGGSMAAGIGGGSDSDAGSVTVNGGNVYAYGGMSGAAIGAGGGRRSYGAGSFTINGGHVYAYGGDSAAGIGGGPYKESTHSISGGRGGTVVINGGSVYAAPGKAYSRNPPAAIGHGDYCDSSYNGRASVSDNVWMFDELNGRFFAPGEGESWSDLLDGSVISFTAQPRSSISYRAYHAEDECFLVETRTDPFRTIDSTVTNWTEGWYAVTEDVTIDRAEVFGHMDLVLADNCTLTVTGGVIAEDDTSLTVYAQSAGENAGKLVAYGADGCAGIGGSDGRNGGTLVLQGGNIRAVGGTDAAGIGGGRGGSGCTVTVCGGVKVSASAGDNAENAIGAGVGGSKNGTVDECGFVLKDTVSGEPIANGFDTSLTDALCDRSEVSFAVVDPEPVSFRQYTAKKNSFEEKTHARYMVLDRDTRLWTDGWYVMNGTGTLDTVVTVSGDVHLILTDGSDLTANGGIRVTEGSTLTVYAQSNGADRGHLTAIGGSYGSGIGGGAGQNGGTLIIHGGSIEAEGGRGAAGIGGGFNADGSGTQSGSVILYGGYLSAVGGDGGAGIGGSYHSAGGSLTVCGGTINAQGGAAAKEGDTVPRAIGSGSISEGDADNGSITVGEGIALLDLASGTRFDKGTEESWTDVLSGSSLSFTAFIPGDIAYLDCPALDGVLVEKSCTAYSFIGADTETLTDGRYAVIGELVIDHPVTVSGSVHLILTDGCSLTVNGGIRVEDGDSLTVYAQSDGKNAGCLTAVGENFSAGIGSRSDCDGGSVTICGGSITSVGGYYAAGIGGGDWEVFYDLNDDPVFGSAGTITIVGGTVKAEGSDNAAGIGGGEGCGGGTISIAGGIVYADGGLNTTEGLGGGLYEIEGPYTTEYIDAGIDDVSVTGGIVYSNGVPYHPAHSFENSTYRDNGDGTHTRKCLYCDEYETPSAHVYTDGVCVCGARDSYGLGISATDWHDVTVGNLSSAFFVDGVQIRLPDKVSGTLQGMRFIASLGKSVLTAFASLNTANVKPESADSTGIGYGFLVSPTDKLSGELTKGNAAVIVPAVNTFEEDETARRYTVCILGIDAAHWKSDITVRPYITFLDENGAEHTAYGDPFAANVYDAVKYGIEHDAENARALTELMENYRAEIA